MRFAKLTPIVAILALAACDSGTDTTAEAPVIEEEAAVVEQEAAEVETEIEQGATAVETEVAEGAAAVEEEVEEDVAVVEPEGGAVGTETAETTTIEPTIEETGEAEVTVITPEGQSQTTAQAPTGGATGGSTEATGALSATTAAMVDPGTYTSDQLSLELAEDGTFTLAGASGEEVTGDWRVFDDTLTLSNAQGATGDASFPMTCTIAEEGEGFRISADTESCSMLDGQIFQPQG